MIRLIWGILIALAVSVAILIAAISIRNNREISLMTFGVTGAGANDYYFSELVDFANSVSSLKTFCRLEILEEDEAFDMLKSNDIQMLMVVPEGFIEAADHMQETSVDIYCPRDMSILQYKVLALFGEIEGIMINTEGAILSMYDGMAMYNFSMSVREMEEGVFNTFIMNFLNRSDYFEDSFISLYGDVPVVVFYICSIFIILIVLSGAVQFRIYGNGEKRIERIYLRGRSGHLLIATWKYLCVSIPIFMEMCIGILAFIISNRFLQLDDVEFGLGAFFKALIIALSIGAFVQITASLIRGKNERVTFYILFTVFMSLVSGMVCSLYYLPFILRKTAFIWPSGYWHKSFMNSVLIYSEGYGDLGLFIFWIILTVTAIGLYYKGLNSHE